MRRSLQLATLAICMGMATSFNYYMASQYIDINGNIALGKPAFQSSTEYGGTAERGNDGGLSGDWNDGTCIHTGSRSSGEWWTVDLGANGTVVKVVKLFNRLDDASYSERLKGVEVRVGNERPFGPGDQNPLCTHETDVEFVYSYPGETPYYPTLFRCDNSAGRYVSVRLATGKHLNVCEVMVFDTEKEDQYILKPSVPLDGSCPSPLAEACIQKEGETKEQAHVRAYMEGPPNCGDKGFFCRILQDPAGRGGMTGGPGDVFVGNENFGYCVDRAVDRRIDWNNLGRQPNNNDGHCHGSDVDEVYIGVLYDHYYRPYRGTLTCCCGLEKRDENNDWTPAKEYISRCDYRGENGNNAAENFERGCGTDMTAFHGPDEFPDKENMCWTMKNYGRPYDYLYGEVTPYEKPRVEVPFCQGGEDNDWAGCVVRVDEKHYGSAVVLVSPGRVEKRMVDDIEGCDEIYDVAVAEAGLSKFKMENLDKHGHETDFFRLPLLVEPGTSAFVQVLDRQRCTISDLIEVHVPAEGGVEAGQNKKLRKLLTI